MRILLLPIFLVCSLLAQAQAFEFVVYFTKGNVARKENKNLVPLKKGDALCLSDMLHVNEKSEVILVCKNYTTVRLKTKGSYAVKNLSDQCSQEKTSFTASYFHYIWDELTHVHGSPEKDPKEYMRNTGAVSRGCNMVQTSLAVDTIHYAEGTLPIRWKSGYQAPQIRVYNDVYEGDLLVRESLGKHPIQMNAIFAKIKDEGIYYWQITDMDGSGCERNYLRYWKAEDYKMAVASLLQSVVTTTPAETAYMKGYLLEEHHFLADAYKYYQLAAKLNPQNTITKKALSRFYE